MAYPKVMASFTTRVSYFAVPMGFDTPDFETEITIFENGEFTTNGNFAEKSLIRSWFHERYPNGTFGLTITVNSNIAQNYDKFDPEKELMEFLEANLANLQRSDKFEWPPRA
jgi:hypothetical protein